MRVDHELKAKLDILIEYQKRAEVAENLAKSNLAKAEHDRIEADRQVKSVFGVLTTVYGWRRDMPGSVADRLPDLLPPEEAV